MRRCLLALAVLASSCTTIKLEEKDAFDRKRTVDLGALRAQGIQVDEHRLKMADGVALDARHFRVPEARGTVLFFGGNGFLMVTAEPFLDAMLTFGVDVVMFDYRGYGRSGGEPGVEALKKDALHMYGWTRETLGVPAERLVLHGHSLGTFVATYVATERPAAGVVLQSPVTSVTDLVDRLTPWIADIFVSFDVDPKLAAEDNAKRVPRLTVPTLFVVGEEDNISPKEMAETLHGLAPAGLDARLVVVEGRGHNDLPPTEAFRTAYRGLLDTVLTPE